MVAGLTTYFFFPETSGIPVEMTHTIFKDHWAWPRMYPEILQVSPAVLEVRLICDGCHSDMHASASGLARGVGFTQRVCKPIAGGTTCEAMLSLAVCETGQQSVRCLGLHRVFKYARGADNPIPDIGILSAAAATSCPLSGVLHACVCVTDDM